MRIIECRPAKRSPANVRQQKNRARLRTPRRGKLRVRGNVNLFCRECSAIRLSYRGSIVPNRARGGDD
jgi:hypothetical protein